MLLKEYLKNLSLDSDKPIAVNYNFPGDGLEYEYFYSSNDAIEFMRKFSDNEVDYFKILEDEQDVVKASMDNDKYKGTMELYDCLNFDFNEDGLIIDMSETKECADVIKVVLILFHADSYDNDKLW